MAQRHASAPKFAARALADEPVQLPAQQPQQQQQERQGEHLEALPPKATTWPWQRAKCVHLAALLVGWQVRCASAACYLAGVAPSWLSALCKGLFSSRPCVVILVHAHHFVLRWSLHLSSAQTACTQDPSTAPRSRHPGAVPGRGQRAAAAGGAAAHGRAWPAGHAGPQTSSPCPAAGASM